MADLPVIFDSTTQGIDKTLAQLERLLAEGADKAADKVADTLHAQIILAMYDANAVASTDLINSIDKVRMQASTDIFSYDVGSPLVYASTLEEGLPPGNRPPTEAIMKWMVFKGLEPSVSAATLIANKIEKVGYKGRKVFAKALEKTLNKEQGIVEIELTNALSKVYDEK